MLNWQANEPKPDVHTQIAALSRFVDRIPERADIRAHLAGLYVHLGEFEKADAVLHGVEAQASPETLISLAKLARHKGKAGDAKEHLIAAREAGSKEAAPLLARMLADEGQHAEAISLCRAGLAADPEHFEAALVLCKCLIAVQDMDGLLSWGASCLDGGDWNALAPTALAYAGETQLIGELVSAEGSISCIEGLIGADGLAQLRDQLLQHKSRSQLPTSNAGKGKGWRISQLLELGIPSVDDLFDRIKQAVEERAREVSVEAQEQLWSCVPETALLETWANIFASDGYEDWHCHPSGWLSGVFYVEVPEVEKDGGRNGQIEFGPLALTEQNDLEAWPKQRITPRNDMLLLFPSYFGHRTYPSRSRQPRISIAFDVVPKGSAIIS